MHMHICLYLNFGTRNCPLSLHKLQLLIPNSWPTIACRLIWHKLNFWSYADKYSWRRQGSSEGVGNDVFTENVNFKPNSWRLELCESCAYGIHYSLTNKSFSMIRFNIRGHDATTLMIFVILRHNQHNQKDIKWRSQNANWNMNRIMKNNNLIDFNK